jgi:hypothetical protein
MTAQAAEPETLTLACQGTRIITTKPEPISMGIIVNFTKNTVQGFGSPGLMDVKIAGSTNGSDCCSNCPVLPAQLGVQLPSIQNRHVNRGR